jgi:hypothetical protein
LISALPLEVKALMRVVNSQTTLCTPFFSMAASRNFAASEPGHAFSVFR